MATAAGAVIAAARRRVEKQFFDKDAFSPDRAIAIDTPRFAQQRFLEQLKDENVVHEIEPGRYWLDLKAYEEMRRARMIAVFKIIGLLIIVMVCVAVVNSMR
jgi:hypothetical protein